MSRVELAFIALPLVIAAIGVLGIRVVNRAMRRYQLSVPPTQKEDDLLSLFARASRERPGDAQC
jgi:hypothetical protein